MRANTQTNLLLESLSAKVRDRLLQQCELIELAFADILCEPGQAITHVFFPVTAFISQVETVGTHPPLEIALIGNEGMLGATLVLGINEAPLRAVVQGAGSSYMLSALKFRQLLRENKSLRRVLNSYMYVNLAQLSQTTACTHFHEVEARLARWLLTTHDRAHADHFHLTHQYLADMLGVQRSAVTIAAGELQQRELISYTRGDIHILDRKGLEKA
ncbi:MAG: Crp/Fnr family transcriptional regulator, partial [Gammaproteobacteria bacterium]